MDHTVLAAIIRPFLLLLLFAAVVIPVELVLMRFWPEGRLKRILFDRTFQTRHPWLYLLVWFIVVATTFASVAWYIETR